MYFLGTLLTNGVQARVLLTYILYQSSCTVRWSALHIPSFCHLFILTSLLVVRAKLNVCYSILKSQGVISKPLCLVLILK